MTTVTMAGMWVQWDETHSIVTGAGRVEMSVVGSGVISYAYQDGWTGGSPPPVQLLPFVENERFAFGDGSVRSISNITDGTSNTIFLGETQGDAPFAGYVLGVSDTGAGIDYYFGLDASLPPFIEGDVDGSVRFLNNLTTSAQQIRGGSFAPGAPIILDGTSNTISVTEDDRLQGDDGNQRYEAGIGLDRVHGAGGQDYLDGGAAADRMYGDAGADTLLGGEGQDLVSGGTGDDICHGGIGGDSVLGEKGNDQLFGGDPRKADVSGADALYGGSGRDSLYGASGADSLDGGSGKDGLFLGAGADTLIFGSGSDRDTVWDFAGSDGDLLALKRDVLAGQTTGQQVIDDFGTVLGDGSVRFVFGQGDELTLMSTGNNLDGLAGHIVFMD